MKNNAKNPLVPNTDKVAEKLDETSEIFNNAKKDLLMVTRQPSILGAVTINTFHPDDLNLSILVNELSDQSNLVKEGDLKSAEGILMIQIHIMNAIFNNLATRAATTEYLNDFEGYMRVALKTQNQCRATLETLAAIKNPAQVAFVQQANIGYNQQVNNTSARESLSPLDKKIENPQNQLLEKQDEKRLDNRTTGTAVTVDKELAAVE